MDALPNNQHSQIALQALLNIQTKKYLISEEYLKKN